jgi:hypothetical protein
MKIIQWLERLFTKKQPVVKEEDDTPSISISVSDIGQTFRVTGGYQYHSNIPNSDNDKT